MTALTRQGGPAVLAVLLAWLLTAWPAFAAPTFPALTGRVVDDAHVLSAQTKTDLEAKLADVEARTGRQLVVATVPSLQGYAIEDYGYQLLRNWGIGQKTANNGVIFLIAPTEHKVRVEVGYGLEPILTDALSSVILQSAVLPKLRAGDVEGGVVAGTNELITQLTMDTPAAEARAQQAARAPPKRHGGGGLAGIIPLIILFIVFSSLFRGRRGGLGGAAGWILPTIIASSMSRRGGGWGDGGGSWGGGGGSWGGGGGGFSGGGGSGGGGGASGSW